MKVDRLSLRFTISNARCSITGVNVASSIVLAMIKVSVCSIVYCTVLVRAAKLCLKFTNKFVDVMTNYEI